MQGLYVQIRMLTDSTHINCVGLDMESREYLIDVLPNTIANPSYPIFRRLISLAVNNEDEEEYIDERGARARLTGQEGIRTLIGEAYYGFPCTQDTHNHLSRFLLGQSFLINQLGDETPLEIRVKYNNGITVFVILADSNEGRKAIIFNIKERGRQNENLFSNLPKFSNEMLRNWNIETVVEITIRGYTHTIAHAGSPSPRRYFDDTRRNNRLSIRSFRSIREYIDEVSNRANTISNTSLVSQGNDQPNNIVQAFREAVLYQHDGNLRQEVTNQLEMRQTSTCSTGAYSSLMLRIRGLIQQMPSDGMLNHEHEFKAVLDGLLTALSDLKLFQQENRNINVIVVPAFQVGGGRRVDLAVQTIERVEGGENISYNNGMLVLMELKLYDNIASSRNFLNPQFQMQGSQLLGYIKSKNLKALTDGREVVILPVAFIQNDGNGRCTIGISTITQNNRTRSVFIAGQVVHSSLQEVIVDPLAQRLSRIA